MRRTGWLLVGILVLGVVGLAAGQGKPEDTVVVYSAADADMVNSMVTAFQQKHPGIKVSTVVAGTGEIIKRVEAEKARPLGDVVWSVGPEALGAQKPLFEPYLTREAGAFYPGPPVTADTHASPGETERESGCVPKREEAWPDQAACADACSGPVCSRWVSARRTRTRATAEM